MGWNNGIEEGYSLEKINLDYQNIEGNWRQSENLLGTPGFKNSVSDLGMDVGIDSLWHELIISYDIPYSYSKLYADIYFNKWHFRKKSFWGRYCTFKLIYTMGRL